MHRNTEAKSFHLRQGLGWARYEDRQGDDGDEHDADDDSSVEEIIYEDVWEKFQQNVDESFWTSQ